MTRRFEGAFTDYDGTIVCEYGTPLREEVKHAFRRLPAELPVFIATGRSVASAPLFVTDLQPQHEMVFENGACITDRDGRIVHENRLGREVVQGVLDACVGYGAQVRYVDDPTRQLYSPHEMPARTSRGLAIAQLSVEAATLLGNTLANELPVAATITYKQTNGIAQPTVRVQQRGISKGVALQYLADRYNIDPANVLAAGNDTNDLSMFALAGTTAAPIGAVPQIAAQADMLYPNPREGGYMHVLKQLYSIDS
jgi:HAD superfamily hydrolase (TIGR01484 family)